jgi:ligand-binding sensor domain-containing protein/signal transduction histidine kinase
MSAKHLFLFFSFWVVLNLPCGALDPSKAVTQYLIDQWQTGDGLPQNSVQAIAQTADGYIWLGTQEGLVRFDGVRFQVFDTRNTPGLKNHYILALFADSDGTLWIGTSGGGLTRFRDGVFKTFTRSEGLSDDYVRCIYRDREGNLWIGTDLGGLNLHRNDKFAGFTKQHGLAHNFVRSIRQDSAGNLWIGTDGGGLTRYRNGIFKTFGVKEGLPNGFIGAILEDRKKDLWLGTLGGGLVLMKNGAFQSFTTRDGLANNFVRSLYQDRNGSIWVGTEGGLSRFREGRFENFSAEDQLSHQNIWALYEDIEGSLWIGNFGGGLSRLKDGKFVTYSRKEGISYDDIWCIYGDPGGAIWIGTVGGGLNRLKDGKVTVFNTRNGLGNNNVRAVWMDRNGTVWAGTSGGGLTAIGKDGKLKTFTTRDGLSNDFVRSVVEDSQGDLWIGTNGGGLNLYRDGKFTHFNTANGFPDDFIRPMIEDSKHNLWIGTEGSGVIRMRNGKITGKFSSREGLSSDRILSIYEDSEGVLWIGSLNAGLSRIKNGAITNYRRKDGLYDDTVFQILEDSNRNLWMGSNRGIFRVNKDDLDDFARSHLQSVNSISYGIGDGMLTNECNGGSNPPGWKDRVGKLWIPTNKGVVVIEPERLPLNRNLPPLHLEQMIVDNTRVVEGTALNHALIFPPGTGRLEFHYTALSFLVPEKVRFQYMLEGFDRQWIDAGNRRIAYYTNIPPGRYTFKMTASNNDGVWNTSAASLSFRLKPHFFQTGWFYALCVLLFSLTVFAIHRLRIRQMQVRFAAVLEERNRISREIHDTLTQDFTGVVLQLEAVEMSLKNPSDELTGLLNRTREIARSGLVESRRFVRELRPAPLEKGTLPDAILYVARQAAGNSGVQVHLDVGGIRKQLPAEVEDNLLRIVREACNNTIKHAGAKDIRIHLKYKSLKVELAIEDNGKGFDTTKITPKRDSGFGLTSMRERAEKMRGKIRYSSTAGKGTLILVTVPIWRWMF